jgi:hypothetical protein
MSKSTPINQLPQNLTKSTGASSGQPDMSPADDDDVAIQEVLAEINASHQPQMTVPAPLIKPQNPPFTAPPAISMDHRYMPHPPVVPQHAPDAQANYYSPPAHYSASAYSHPIAKPPTMIETMFTQLWSMFKNEFTLFAIIALASAFINTSQVESFVQQYLSFIHFSYSQLLIKGVLTAVIVMVVRAAMR